MIEKPINELKVVRVLDVAAMLHATPQTVRIKAKAGLIPGRKVGKHRIFSVVALERYLTGEWEPRAAQGDEQELASCRYSNEVRVPTGITASTR